eukprot:4542149-Lingulodinium_polyedra.AAC.1
MFLGFRVTDVTFDVLGDHTKCCELILVYACNTLIHGETHMLSPFRHLSAILGQWLVPELSTNVRENQHVLQDSKGRKEPWKVMMRSMHPTIQEHLMGIKSNKEMLSRYLRVLLRLLLRPAEVPHRAF